MVPVPVLRLNLSPMLKEYYEFRGWDANGVPTPTKLRELDLEGLRDDQGGASR